MCIKRLLFLFVGRGPCARASANVRNAHSILILLYLNFGSAPGHHIHFLVQFPAEHLPAAVGGYVDHLIIKPECKAQYRMPLRSGSARLCLFRKRTLDRRFACNLGGKEAYLEAGTWGSRGGVFGEYLLVGVVKVKKTFPFFPSLFFFLDGVL